jgi:hypothetical protein
MYICTNPNCKPEKHHITGKSRKPRFSGHRIVTFNMFELHEYQYEVEGVFCIDCESEAIDIYPIQQCCVDAGLIL